MILIVVVVLVAGSSGIRGRLGLFRLEYGHIPALSKWWII